jgi:hypothetical protein
MADEDRAYSDAAHEDTEAPKGVETGFKDRDGVEQDVFSGIAEKKDASQARETTLPATEAPAEKAGGDAPPGKGRRELQQVVADKMFKEAPPAEETKTGPPASGDLVADSDITATEEVMQPQPLAEGEALPPPAAPMPRSRTITEARKVKDEPSPEEGLSRIATLVPEAEEQEPPEPPAMKALSVGSTSLPEQRIGEKIFHLKENMWVDTAYTPEQELLTIKRDSQAYHDLLATLPDLQEYFDIGEHIIVVIGENALEIADEGKSELTKEELEKLSEP